VKLRPVITLGIPTYNREEEIIVTLKTIIDNLDYSLINKVEILIIDNASLYDINEVLGNIIKDLKAVCQIRVIRNNENIGYDANYLKILKEAKGEYILQCSDRYYYNIEFGRLIAILEKERPNCIIFSDRFRQFNESDVSFLESFYDEWLAKQYKVELDTELFYSKVSFSNFLKKDYIQKGLVNAISDVVFLNIGNPNWDELEKYLNLYMLPVASQINSISLTLKNDSYIYIMHTKYNSVIHQNVGTNNLYTRHNYNNVLHGNLLMQNDYPFIGDDITILNNQVSNLVNLLLKQKAGIYYTLVNIDINLINSFRLQVNLNMKDSLSLFLLKLHMPAIILRAYIAFISIVRCIKKDIKLLKENQRIVTKLKNENSNIQ